MGYYTEFLIDALLGQHVEALRVATDGSYIQFHTEDDNDVNLFAEGDCCSTSWIQGIEGVEALLGGTIMAVEELDLEEPNDPSRQTQERNGDDSIAYYGLKIVTDKGVAVIDYRNASNGYYGGSLQVCGKIPGDVEMRNVTEDFF